MLGLEYDPMQLTQLISVLMVAGLIAGFVAGLFGIGGGFVVVPALLLVFSFFGVDGEVLTHVAIGTSLATIIVTSSRSVHAHNKRGSDNKGLGALATRGRRRGHHTGPVHGWQIPEVGFLDWCFPDGLALHHARSERCKTV